MILHIKYINVLDSWRLTLRPEILLVSPTMMQELQAKIDEQSSLQEVRKEQLDFWYLSTLPEKLCIVCA